MLYDQPLVHECPQRALTPPCPSLVVAWDHNPSLQLPLSQSNPSDVRIHQLLEFMYLASVAASAIAKAVLTHSGALKSSAYRLLSSLPNCSSVWSPRL